MGSMANSASSFSLNICISLFSGMLESGEGNPNLVKTTDFSKIFFFGEQKNPNFSQNHIFVWKKHKQTAWMLCGCGCLQHSWAGSIFLSLCCPEAQDPSIHELRAAPRVQHLPGGRKAPRNWGASHENIGNGGCLVWWGFSPLIFTPKSQWMLWLWGPLMLLGRASRCFCGGNLIQPFQRVLLTITP